MINTRMNSHHFGQEQFLCENATEGKPLSETVLNFRGGLEAHGFHEIGRDPNI